MNYKKILILVLIILIFNISNVFGLSIESTVHSPGQVYFKINGIAPFEIKRSINSLNNFESLGTIETNEFFEQGLEPISIYWYEITEISTGDTLTVKYSSPITNINVYPLEVTQLGDDYIQVNWSHLLHSVDLYLNGSLLDSDITETTYTINNLQPNREYTLYYIDSSGMISNTIRFTTLNELSNFMDELDYLLRKLFVSNDFKIDSNNDGISDGFQPVKNRFDDLINGGVGKYPQDIRDSIIDSSDNVNSDSLDDLPTFDVEFIKGYTINVFDFTGLEDLVKQIRNILVAVLYVGLFLYFVKKLIPKLNA